VLLAQNGSEGMLILTAASGGLISR